MANEIVYEAGAYRVQEIQRAACRPCVIGWTDGSLLKPTDGGVVCTHGRGLWQAGKVGPRGGWYGIGPVFRAERAARLVCDALAEAAEIPPQGR